jgi:nucleotide-binding universal stress UspA family protein
MSVVVGVDGTEASQAAIRMAAEEARYRQAPLIAVMAYSGERTLGALAGQPVATLATGGDQRTAAESSLRNLVIGALGKRADHVELRVVAGIAGRQIVEAAREARAQLIVLATAAACPCCSARSASTSCARRRAPSWSYQPEPALADAGLGAAPAGSSPGRGAPLRRASRAGVAATSQAALQAGVPRWAAPAMRRSLADRLANRWRAPEDARQQK